MVGSLKFFLFRFGAILGYLYKLNFGGGGNMFHDSVMKKM